MDKTAAQKLVRDTLQNPFNKERFVYLVKNILNHFEEAPLTYKGNLIFDDFADSIRLVERVGKYKSPDEKLIDILIVHLQKETSLERARTKQRNFVAKYLKGSRGGVLKDAALVAFVSPNEDDWRFSLVKMDYRFKESPSGKVKVEEEFTPARRYSFLVGKNENSHTAQSRLLPLLLDDEISPTLQDLENTFSVEKVTKEFFEKYRDLFVRFKEALDEVVKKDGKVKADFKKKNIDTADFCKKLLGQIVFLYFLQKKGWFGVKRGKEWGSGSKHFLRELFEKKHGGYLPASAGQAGKNFFNDILEPLFYEALRLERPGDYYSRFDCRIPFLNGGLFDPINNYDWWNTDILLPDELFSNNRKTKEGDTGDGILDIFDRYNFTVKEDEPLEKEVAVDPEMLGKVFENLLEVKDRKSKGTYYTPREIVHYMCQESLANYLATELEGKASKEDIETLIKYGETVVEHEAEVESRGKETKTYSYKLPKSIRDNAKLIDEKLATIRICDPAVGSGAFPVGMMNEIVRTRNALTPYIGKDGKRTPYHFKREVIQNCLYGVDIDPGAVEIAKLRLWLSLVVDEEERKTIQPLPNLDYKIVQGNSLLSVKKDLFNERLFNKLEELKPLYFNETSASKKQEYRKQIEELISQITNGHKDFDFEVYFSEVFHEKGGFDVVIANPPYVHIRTKSFDRTTISILKKNFRLAVGQFDYFVLFTELSARILKSDGVYAFIIPKRVLSNQNYEPLRKFYLKHLPVVSYLDAKMPFEFANVEANVLIAYKAALKNGRVKIGLFQENKITQMGTIGLDFATKMPFSIFPFTLTKSIINILMRLAEGSPKLLEFVDITRGYEFGFNHPAITNKNIEGGCPIIRGENIKKYYISFDGLYLDLKQLDRGQSKKKEIFLPPKLVTKFVSNDLVFAYDDMGFYNTNVVYNVRPNNDSTNLKYLLALLNSTLLSFWFRKSFLNEDELFPHIQKNQLEAIPIKIASMNAVRKLTETVDKILAITKDDDYLENPAKQAKVREYEKQIDQLVYNLYGLTDEEIKIVEGK